MLFGKNGNASRDPNLELTLEAQSLIMEAALFDTLSPEELTAFLENSTEVNSALRDEVVLEKTIVRLDKKAKLQHAQKMAVFTIAKERNDPMMRKLLTVWRMERFLEAKLYKKYASQALSRARQAMRNSAQSKSTVVQHVANNVNKQLSKLSPK